MTHPGQLTEPVKIQTCRGCGRPILIAHTEGLLVACDPQVLDTPSEIAAIFAGRSTYNLTSHADGHFELARRHTWRIQANHLQPVVAEHYCHQRPVTGRASAPVLLTTHVAKDTDDDRPPF